MADRALPLKKSTFPAQRTTQKSTPEKARLGYFTKLFAETFDPAPLFALIGPDGDRIE